MATDIEFNIVGNFNTDSLKQMLGYIEQARSQMEVLQMDLDTSMQGMSAPAKLLSGQLDRCLITADRITEKANAAAAELEQGSMSEDDIESASRLIQNMYSDLMTSKNLLTGKGSLSIDMAKSMMQGLPEAIKKEFNAAAPQIVSALRTAMKSTGSEGLNVFDIAGTVDSAMKNSAVQRAFGQTSATAKQRSDFIRSLLVNAVPVHRLSEYQLARHGRTLIPEDKTHVEDVLPELYKGSYADQGYRPAYSKKTNENVLKDSASDRLMQLFRQNNVATQAAENSGLLRRNGRGELEMVDSSRGNLLRFSEELWKQFQKRTNGLGKKEEDYFDTRNHSDQPGSVQGRIIRRAASGNGGKATAAMALISDLLIDEGNFEAASSAIRAPRVLPAAQEPKRLKELYTVGKINPFKGYEVNVPIAESQMTELLGLKGHDYEKTDAVKIISLDGYDPKNPEHVKMAREYRQNGYTIDGQHYDFHTMHGTGNDLTYRMIRSDLKESIQARYKPMAEKLGLAGNNIFEAFMPTNEFENMTAMAKYYDQLNKMWTDSYSLGTDISGKKFAIVDMSAQEDGIKKEFANGIGYVGRGIIPHALQARGAISLKGSLEEFGADTVGEWGEKTGKQDEQGRVMFRGLNGQMFDASSYHGILDISQIKNKDAYMQLANEQGNDAANAAFTEVLRAFPLRAVSDYSFDGEANSLGPQMMTFLALSPEMQKYQAGALVKRLQELHTMEGLRRHIFNNPETDPVSAKANDPVYGDQYLETSDEVANRTNLYISKLLRRAGSGEFINYDDIADIQNEALLRSADASWAMTQGGLTENELVKYRAAFQKAHGRSFSDEEIRKYLMLEGGVADFGHIDSARVSASRSPTGFGQIITRDNYAGILAPVMKELYGVVPTGFYGNEDDYKILSGADMDADRVKAIADKENAAGLSIVSEIGKVEDKYNALMLPMEKLEVGFQALKGADGKIDMSNPEVREKAMEILTEAAVTAPLDMGFFSNAQSRLAGNLDLFDAGMELAALTAARANSGYDRGTTKQKSPGEIEKDNGMFGGLDIGPEYTKIPAHLTEAFNVKKVGPDPRDEGYTPDQVYYEGAHGEVLDPSDVFETSSGRLVDKRFFDKLDKTNLPAFQSSTAVGAMFVPKAAREAGFVDDSLYNELAEVFGIRERTGGEGLHGTALGFGGYGAATQRVMKNHRDLIAQFAGHKRFSISDEELEIMASQYAEAMQEITKEGADLQSEGKPLLNGNGKAVSLESWVQDRAKRAGLDQIAAALGTHKVRDANGNVFTVNTGMTYGNLAAKYNKDVAESLQNPEGTTLADMTRGNFGASFAGFASYRTYGEDDIHYVDSARDAELESKKKEADNRVSAAAKRYEEIQKKLDEELNHANHDLEESKEAEIKTTNDLIKSTEEVSETNQEEAKQNNADAESRKKVFENDKVVVETMSRLPAEAQLPYKETKNKRKDKRKSTKKEAALEKNTAAEQENKDSPRIAELKKELVEAEKEEDAAIEAQQDIEALIKEQAEYRQLVDNARETSDSFRIRSKGKENKLKGRSFAQAYFNRAYYGEYIPQQEALDVFLGQHPNLDEQQKSEIKILDKMMRQNLFEDFANEGTLYAKGYADDLEKQLLGKTNPPSKQKKVLDNFTSTAEEAAGFIKQIDKVLSDQNIEVDESSRKKLEQAKENISASIQKGSELQKELTEQFKKENNENALLRTEDLKAKYNKNYKKSGNYQAILRNREIDALQKDLDQQQREGLIGEESYSKASKDLAKMRQDAVGWKITMTEGLQSVGKLAKETVSRMGQQFGRQMWHSAVNETKKFVQEFDKSMTEIQMITLKSDSQISELGSNLINTAKNLKMSVPDVTSSAATLYRQGLNDQEVEERLGVISKFSKVSGTKVDDATKLITVAMNTGLVDNAQEAADIVTALGDNAATNAAQIEKGIEKAGAAAAADGTTFAELASMLTAITSTTQIGGNVAGRTINTIMGRMNKIGTSELIYDENGNAISGSDVAKLLSAQGVDTYRDGQKRSTFDVLYDLSQKWEGMSDAEQQQIANAIAGTRQYSNFAAIMHGMAEGKVDEYMELAGESTGITDKKYDVYVNSLEASLANLRTTFDGLVKDLTDSGTLSGFLDMVTGMIQGVDNLSNSFSGLGALLVTVLPLLAGTGLLKLGAGMGVAGLPVMAAGLAMAAVGGGIAYTNGNKTDPTKEYSDVISRTTESDKVRFGMLDQIKGLRDKADRSGDEEKQYRSLIENYASYLDETAAASDSAASSVGNLASAISELSNADEAADKIIEEAEKRREEARAASIDNNRGYAIQAIEKEIQDNIESNKGNDNLILNTLLSGKSYSDDKNLFGESLSQHPVTTIDNEGNIQLSENALENIKFLADMGQIGDEAFGLGSVAMKVGTGTSFSWNKDLKSPLSNLFYNAAQNGLLGEEEIATSPEAWAARIANGFITQDQLETAFNFYKRNNSTEKEDSVKDIFKNKFTDALTPWGYDNGQIDYLAGLAAERYRSNGEDVADAYNYILKPNSSSEEKKNQVNTLLKGYYKGKTEIEKLGLEDAGVGGYYINEATGEILSAEETKNVIESYNAALENEQTESRVVLGTDKTRVFDAKNYITSGSSEAAKAEAEALNERGYYYWTDENGNVRSKNRNREWYSSEEEAKADAKNYDNTLNKTWKAWFEDKNTGKIYEETGLTKKGADNALDEVRKDVASKAFGLETNTGKILEGRYGSYGEAFQAAILYNAQEKERNSREIQAALAEQASNTTANFAGLPGWEGPTYVKGAENVQALTDQIKEFQRTNPYAITRGGEIIDTAKSMQGAMLAADAYTRIENAKDFTVYGYGEEGRKAFNEAKAAAEADINNYEFFAGGKSQGRGEEGKKAAEAFGKWHIKDRKGNDIFYDDYDEAVADLESERAFVESLIENDIGRETASLMNTLNPPDLTTEQAQKVLRNNAENNNRWYLKNLSKEVEPAFSQKYVGQAFDMNEVQEAAIRPLEDIYDVWEGLKVNIPKLADVAPADFAQVWGQLPTEIQTALESAATTGQYATEVIEAVNEEIVKVQRPKIKTVRNYFQSGIATGTAAWNEKNSEAVIADQMLRMINTEENGITDIQSLFDYVNENGISQWSILNQNADFAKLVSPLVFDEHGRLKYGENAVSLENIKSKLMSMGLDYGTETLTAQETGQRAQQAFEKLQNNAFLSQGMAEQAYNQERKLAEEEIREGFLGSSRYKGADEKEIDKLVNDQLKREGLASLDDYLTREQRGIFTEQDSAYLKSVLGEGLAQKASLKNLNAEETALANTLLGNAAYGYSGLSASQKLEGIKEIRGRIANNTLTGYSSYAADQYMSGWSNWSRFSQLQQQIEGGQKLSEEDLKEYNALNAELENLQKNAEIDIKVQGLPQLEEAGKLLQGTADIVKQLQKGGSFEIEARMKLASDLYSQAQLDAMLNSGNATLVDRAAQQITGASGTQYYENRDYWIQQAQTSRSTKRVQTAESLMQDYNAAQDKEAFLASQEGTGWSYTEAPVKDERATTLYQRGELDEIPKGYELINGALYRTSGRFVYNQQDYKYDNPYVGAEKNYTDLELHDLRQQILNGTLTKDDDGYATAMQSGGQKWRRYRWLYDNGNIQEAEAMRGEVDIEENIAKLQGQVSEGQARGETLSLYQGLTSKAADEQSEAAKSLLSQTLDLQKKQSQLRQLQSFSTDEWAARSGSLINDLGQTMGWTDQETARYRQMDQESALSEMESKVQKDVDKFGDIFGDLVENISGLSLEDFSSLSELQTALDGLSENGNEAAGSLSLLIAALAEIAGLELKDGKTTTSPSTLTLDEALNQGSYLQKKSDIQTYDNLVGAIQEGTTIESLIGEEQIFKSNQDLQDYLTRGNVPGLQDILNRVRANGGTFTQEDVTGLTALSSSAALTNNSTVPDQIEKLRKYLTPEGLDTAGLAEYMKTGDADFNNYVNGLENITDAATGVDGAVSRLNSEVLADFVVATNKYGKNSKAVAESIKGWGGTAAEVTAEQKKLNQALASGASKQRVLDRFNKGKKNYDEVAGILGMNKEQVKLMGDETIKAQLQAEIDVDAETVQNSIQGQFDQILADMGPIPAEIPLETVIKEDGTVDSTALEALASEAGNSALSAISNIVAQLSTMGATVKWHAEDMGDGVAIKVDSVDMTGTGKGGGGGGGGGGGKSAIDTLLERQKHEVAEQQHEIKMTQIQEAHYERLNEYDKYIDTLDEEIAKQTNLRDVYARHLKELQDMMSGLEEYSDDWWKAKEAIAAAEEALAEYSNTVDEINAKKIQAISTKQENEDKPGSHRTNMFEKRAQYYMDRGQFENYAVLVEKEVAQMRADIALNDQQISEWEGMLTQYEENSKEWIEVRDKIWATKEENADLENQAFEKIAELQQQRIAQIQTDYQNGIAPIEHEQNMLGIWGSIYQNAGRSVYYDEEGNQHTMQEAYRNTLDQDTAYNEQTLTRIRSTIKLLQEQMATLDEGTDAWYAARDAIYQYEEQEAQLVAKNQENDIAKEESYVTELTDKREASTKELEHELNMIETIQERFENSNDYENSENMMEERRTKLEEMREQAARNLEEAQALLNSGKLDPGGDRYKTVRDDVMQLTEEYEKLTNKVENADRKIQETKLEHILEKFENQDGLIQHQLKLVQYEQTRYQNSGELTNYGTMLEIENDLQRDRAKLLKEQIGLLEEQLEAAEPGSDTYQKITKEIYKMEESLASVNNTIEKNNEAIRKNQENIVKTRKALIDMIDHEIKTRVKEQRDRLNAEVSIQNQILNIIRNRYKQEWAIVKADIDKKKQALQEEKALINERLNARINAEKEEERYTKLSELQRQLTLISADPTRTKDAIELQRQIDDLLKEIANETAQQEANAAGEQLDDQIKAYDAYAQYTEEALNEMLKDANSTELFEELNAVMGDESMSREERLENYMNWIKENDDNYKFGTEAMRLQLEQNNTDSWNKMLGFVDTYWDQVEDIISGGAQSIIDYMKESSSYIWNSDAGQRLLELQWSDTYDKYVKSTIDDAVFNDIHELAEYASQLQDYTYKVELTPESIYRLGIYDSELKYQYERDKSVSDEAKNFEITDYAEIGKQPDPELAPSSSGSNSSGSGNGGSGNSGSGKGKGYRYEIEDNGTTINVYEGGQYETWHDAFEAGHNEAKKVREAYKQQRAKTREQLDNASENLQNTISKIMTNLGISIEKPKMQFASGGLVDFTGPAWVDGTPTRPEAFLDATDTESIRAMLDGLNYVQTMPMLSPSEKFFGNSSTVGDINIVINQAELKSDADYDEVARRVGQAFTKQLSKDGLQLSGYNW